MVWDWIKKQLGIGQEASSKSGNATADLQIPWIDSADNPWGVPVLDVRPVTLEMLSASKDALCAENLNSFSRETGVCFLEDKPRVDREIPASLRFPIHGMLYDGALFTPDKMEHKWAIFYHQGKILCVRSWLRQLEVCADTTMDGDELKITRIRGVFDVDTESPDFTVRTLDYLLRSHALNMTYPAPLHDDPEIDPKLSAFWCMSKFGNQVSFATPHKFESPLPETPLRTYSVLHLSVVHGDTTEVSRLLASGMSPDILAADGMAPLHWAIVRDGTEMLRLLLDGGAFVDVRADDGCTPLVHAAQSRKLDSVAFLLERGADPNAADNRGFTALHRAAEMGELEIARLLLAKGAYPKVEAQGHTPLSLATIRSEAAMVDLLKMSE